MADRYNAHFRVKMESLYRIDTTKLKREEVKKIVWRFIVYYNRRRITTMNPKGYPPAIYRELFENRFIKTGSLNYILGNLGSALLLTFSLTTIL